MITTKKHDWYMGFPGNYCKTCGMEDPTELCMGCCEDVPSDENGYPDPNQCPVHGLKFSPGLYQCPPNIGLLSPEARKFYHLP